MSQTIPDIIQLRNEELCLEIERQGATFRSLRHQQSPLNPIDFRMPRGEDTDQWFTGQFLCAPRWGDASEGETRAGSIKHGDLMHRDWVVTAFSDTSLSMWGESQVDQIRLERTIQLSSSAALVKVKDRLTNLSNHFRPCNLVQHPTLAGEFLHSGTLIDCNATTGYAYRSSTWEPFAAGNWPKLINAEAASFDLRHNAAKSHGVYSFAVGEENTAWISAYDPNSLLLLGYCWEKHHYPWIHHWIHAENDRVIYRGMEFGTAGFHQSFRAYAERSNWQVNGRPTSAFLDAKDSRDFEFYFFLLKIENELSGISRVNLEHDHVKILSAEGEEWNLPFV
jgi:hypothetical protein